MAFFAHGPAQAGWAGDSLHAKVIGNGLRELDRFLSILLDELARASGWAEADVDHLIRTRSTVRKLAFISMRMGLVEPDLERWRALGRSRDCLFYTCGVVSRADRRTGTSMTLGWPGACQAGGRPNHVFIGRTLSLTTDDVIWICTFYKKATNDLMEMFSKDARR